MLGVVLLIGLSVFLLLGNRLPLIRSLLGVTLTLVSGFLVLWEYGSWSRWGGMGMDTVTLVLAVLGATVPVSSAIGSVFRKKQ